MNSLKKWLINNDMATIVAGALLVYFSETIVTLLYPTDPLPSATISFMYYFVFFTISVFWIFKGIVYYTIKIYWDGLYQYFEDVFNKDLKETTPTIRICVTLGFYLFLLLSLAVIFLGSVSVL